MNRRLLLVALVLPFLFIVAGAVNQPTESLPGARPDIQAANFPSLQAALDAVPEEGGLVQLPSGTFEIHQPLVIRRSDICLRGAGTATHIKNTNTDGLPAIIIAHPDHERRGNNREHELWRVRLANFRVTGNPKSGDGMVAYNVNELFIDGVTTSYHGGDGFELSYCYEDPRIADSLITYNKQTGINLVGCHDIVVSSNQLEENLDGLHCFDGYNLCMTGNCLDDHLGRGVVIENTYGSVVSGNMIEECQSAALVMDRDCYGNSVSANVIAHNGAGIDLRDAHGCAISANTFTIMASDAVRVGPNSGNIALCANIFSDSTIGAGQYKRADSDRKAAGLTIQGSAGVLVSANGFTGITETAIRIASPKNPSVLTGNYFVDTDSGVDTSQRRGVVTEQNFTAPR